MVHPTNMVLHKDKVVVASQTQKAILESLEIDDFGRLFFVLLVLVYTCCESSRFPPLNQMNVKVVVVVVVVVPPFAKVDEIAACIMFATISACEILWQILRNSIAVENFQRFWSKTFQMLQSYLVGKLGHRKSGWRGFTIPPPKKKTIRTTTWPFWDQRMGALLGDLFTWHWWVY